MIAEQIESIRNDVSNKLEGKIIAAINSTCDTMVEQCREQLTAEHFSNVSLQQVQAVQNELNNYIQTVDKRLK